MNPDPTYSEWPKRINGCHTLCLSRIVEHAAGPPDKLVFLDDLHIDRGLTVPALSDCRVRSRRLRRSTASKCKQPLHHTTVHAYRHLLHPVRLWTGRALLKRARHAVGSARTALSESSFLNQVQRRDGAQPVSRHQHRSYLRGSLDEGLEFPPQGLP